VNKKAIILVLILSYIAVSSYAQQDKVEVTYIGNSGFMINIGDKKILIDALFKGFAGDYELPQEVQEKLTLAQAPFDNVDLILVTHAHGDHINPEMVNQHMQNNPGAIFASTKQLVDALNAVDTLNIFKERRIPFDPIKGESEVKDIRGISIETFNLPHGTESRIINIGFLISVNGITLFQTGDADFDQYSFDEFRSFKLPEREIDLAFIQHYYLVGDSLSTKFVKEGIGGDYILPIHYHFTTPPFDSAIVRENYPDAVIFSEEMQSWYMPDRNDRYTAWEEDYFGQAPPGDTPVVFAPTIISVDSTVEHGSPAFSPDGNEVFWQSNLRHEGKETEIFLYTMRRFEGKWTAPEVSPYGGMPAFSPDGKKLFFLPFDTEKEKGLYMIKKRGENWGKPEGLNLIARYPELKYLYGPSVTNNGTLYFFAHAEGLGSLNDYGIYRSQLINGEYAKPELLPPSVNAGDSVLNWTPFIAPDESFLLFSSSRTTSETDFGDIYVCFRRSDGSWTEAINLGATINSGRQERFPAISPDGKYLFFTRWVVPGNEDVMWVSASIIDRLKEEIDYK